MKRPDEVAAPDDGDPRRKLDEYERRLGLLNAEVRRLERERQRFSAVVSHAGAAFLVVNADLEVTWINDRGTAWFGGGAPAVGRRCHQVLCRGTRSCDACPVARPFDGREVAHREMRLTVNGQLRHMYATAVPLASPDGRVEEAMVMLQDISEMEILRTSEEALRASEARFRSIFENAAAGVVATRADGTFLQANPAFCTMLGYSETELRQRNVLDVTHPADRQATQAHFALARIGHQQPAEMEKRYVRRDGTTVWATTHSSWLMDADGKALHAVALVQDITERKRAENLVRGRETRLRLQQTALLDLARSKALIEGDLGEALAEITEVASRTLRVERASVWLLDEDHSTLSCVDLYEAGTEAHTPGTELAQADYPAYFAALEENRTIAAHDAHRDPRTAEFSTSYLLPAGITSMLDAPVRMSGRTVGVACFEHVGPSRRWTLEEQNFAGSIADMVSLALEQREHREAEEARALLAAAVEQAVETVVVTDAAGRVQYANPAFTRNSGYSLDEVRGRAPRFLDVEGDDAADARKTWERLREGKTWSGHLRRRRKQGGVYEEEATVSPVRDGSGRIVNYVIVTRDVTRQAELEEQLRQSQKMEAIGNLAGGVAHDFNNLLTGILGYGNLVKRAAHDDPSLREAAEVIERAAMRGAELTRQLLGYARKGKNRDVSVDLHRSVREVVALLSRTIDKKIAIEQRLEATAPFVQGDPSQMQQVLLNLAVNARDAMPDGGKLVFETDAVTVDEGAAVAVPPGRYVRISVSDDGPGIDRDTIDHIFEPFFTTKARGKGTGMGLAMVYGIVQNHGGTILVDSEAGRGTTFRVHLPAARERPTEDDTAELPTGRASGRVLVVDDEAFIRSMAAEMLASLGYEVTTAANGREALEAYADEDFDMVLLDMVMPSMGGRDCYRALREMNPEVRTVLSTGHGFNVDAQQILDEGVMAILPKPYTITELADAVGKVLGR